MFQSMAYSYQYRTWNQFYARRTRLTKADMTASRQTAQILRKSFMNTTEHLLNYAIWDGVAQWCDVNVSGEHSKVHSVRNSRQSVDFVLQIGNFWAESAQPPMSTISTVANYCTHKHNITANHLRILRWDVPVQVVTPRSSNASCV